MEASIAIARRSRVIASGEVEPAVQDLETVTKAEPEWLEPHVKLASLLYRLHRENDARREEEIIGKLRDEDREKAVPLPGMQSSTPSYPKTRSVRI